MIAFLDFFARVVHQSFYKQSLYREAAYHWRGRGLSILAFATLLMTIVSTVSMIPLFQENPIKDALVEQMPTLAIKDGVLSMQEPSPHVIKFENTQNTIVVDTSAETASLSQVKQIEKMKAEKIEILVLPTKAIIANKDSYNETSFNEIQQDITFSSVELDAFFDGLHRYGIFIFALIGFGATFLYGLVIMLMLSLGAWFLLRSSDPELPYAGVQRVTVCAMIPMVMIGVVANLLGIALPRVILVLVVFIYLNVAARALASR